MAASLPAIYRRQVPLAALALLALPQGSPAQDTERHKAAIAAGYKAAFLCSGLFNAHRTQTQIEGDDLSRIYPEYRARVAVLTASVDAAAKTVSVAYAPDMPPRIAAWRPYLGCAQLPIGAPASAVAGLPKLEATPPATDFDSRLWPMGDQAAGGPPMTMGASTQLGHVVAAAFDRKTYGETSETAAVVVVKDGRIVAERYRDGFDAHTPLRTWSAAKSITGTLIGIAVKQGLLDVNKPAPVPEWRTPGDPRAAITLGDLLHMGSGLDSEARGNRTDAIYFGGAAVTERATAAPLEAPPGKRWKYANDDTLLAVRSLRAAIGDDQRYLAFPFQELFWKIGMAHTTPETDWAGNYILSSQVWTTGRDLARLGLLYQNGGVWNGQRLLPAGWTDYVAMPAPAQPDNAVNGNGAGYGAQFWLFGPRQGLPAGVYAAQGSRGQFLMIVPSEHLIVVRQGFDGLGPGEAQFDIARFTADVIAALNYKGGV